MIDLDDITTVGMFTAEKAEALLGNPAYVPFVYYGESDQVVMNKDQSIYARQKMNSNCWDAWVETSLAGACTLLPVSEINRLKLAMDNPATK